MTLCQTLKDFATEHCRKGNEKPRKCKDSYVIDMTNKNVKPSARKPHLGNDIFAKYPHLERTMGKNVNQKYCALSMQAYMNLLVKMQETLKNDYTVQLRQRFKSHWPSQLLARKKALETTGVKLAALYKDEDGKIGLRVHSIKDRVFIVYVMKKTPASIAGFKFGDEILEINGISVSGLSTETVHDIFKKAPEEDLIIIITRNRPFGETLTLRKEISGHSGFTLIDGRITMLVLNSPADKSGLLTENYLVEVNGQNVVGFKDKEINKIIPKGGDEVTVTIIPVPLFEELTKGRPWHLLKNQIHD